MARARRNFEIAAAAAAAAAVVVVVAAVAVVGGGGGGGGLLRWRAGKGSKKENRNGIPGEKKRGEGMIDPGSVRAAAGETVGRGEGMIDPGSVRAAAGKTVGRGEGTEDANTSEGLSLLGNIFMPLQISHFYRDYKKYRKQMNYRLLPSKDRMRLSGIFRNSTSLAIDEPSVRQEFLD